MDTDVVVEYVYRSPRSEYRQYMARFRCSVPMVGGQRPSVAYFEIPISRAYARRLEKRIHKENRIIGEGIVRSTEDLEALIAALKK